MRPPWAKLSPILQWPHLAPNGVSSPVTMHSTHGAQDSSVVKKLKLAGSNPRLSTPGSAQAKASRKSTPKIITGQWAPAEVLGPYMPPRTRFNKDSFFLEGLSVLNLPKKAPLREKAKSESEKMSSEDECSIDFDGFAEEEGEEEAVETHELDIDAAALERDRMQAEVQAEAQAEAEEKERQADQQLEHAQKNLELMSNERIETAKRLMALENLISGIIAEKEEQEEEQVQVKADDEGLGGKDLVGEEKKKGKHHMEHNLGGSA